MLGSLIIYLKGMRRMMFQLSGFYYMSFPYASSDAAMDQLASACKAEGRAKTAPEP